MESYGIHEAQMNPSSYGSAVQTYNERIRNHNAMATKSYQDTKKQMGTSNEIKGGMDAGGTAFKTLSGIHAGMNSYAMVSKFGGGWQGMKSALVDGTSQNVNQMTKGLLGTKAIGPELENAGESIADEGLSLEGKLGKSIAKASGISEDVAHVGGALLGPISDVASGVTTAVEDFGEGKWKSQNKTQDAGDTLGMIGDAVGVASSFAPVLAPISAALEGASALVDWIGDDEADKSKASANLSDLKQNTETTVARPAEAETSTATFTGPTALQKVSGHTSSY